MMLKSTGTTICGLLYKDGVILGADTRASYRDEKGSAILIDSNCSKIFRLATRIYCCGAGSAADMTRLSGLVEGYLESQFRPERVPVICPVTLIKRKLYAFNGYLMCTFIVGGVDPSGESQLYSIYQHGSMHSHKFCAFGSGLNPAMGILEAGWKESLSEQEGIELVKDAISAGIKYDLGSGSNVDVTIIRNTGDISNHKPYCVAGRKLTMSKPKGTSAPIGPIRILSEKIEPVVDRFVGGTVKKQIEVKKMERAEGSRVRKHEEIDQQQPQREAKRLKQNTQHAVAVDGEKRLSDTRALKRKHND